MNRVLSREELIEESITLDKFKVGILGLSPSAGATFLVLCLSRMAANMKTHNVTVVEVNGESIYDSMALDKRFADRGYFLFHEEILKGNSIRGKRNFDEDINWVAEPPNSLKEELDLGHKLRLINNVSGNLIFCDFSGEQNRPKLKSKEGILAFKTNRRLLEDMDKILFVIDPMPSKMLGGFELLQEIKSINSHVTVTFVINKYNKGINLKEMNDFLKLKSYISLPFLNGEVLYNAEYNCKSPFSQREVRNQLSESLQNILNTLL